MGTDRSTADAERSRQNRLCHLVDEIKATINTLQSRKFIDVLSSRFQEVHRCVGSKVSGISTMCWVQGLGSSRTFGNFKMRPETDR